MVFRYLGTSEGVSNDVVCAGIPSLKINDVALSLQYGTWYIRIYVNASHRPWIVTLWMVAEKRYSLQVSIRSKAKERQTRL